MTGYRSITGRTIQPRQRNSGGTVYAAIRASTPPARHSAGMEYQSLGVLFFSSRIWDAANISFRVLSAQRLVSRRKSQHAIRPRGRRRPLPCPLSCTNRPKGSVVTPALLAWPSMPSMAYRYSPPFAASLVIPAAANSLRSVPFIPVATSQELTQRPLQYPRDRALLFGGEGAEEGVKLRVDAESTDRSRARHLHGTCLTRLHKVGQAAIVKPLDTVQHGTCT